MSFRQMMMEKLKANVAHKGGCKKQYRSSN